MVLRSETRWAWLAVVCMACGGDGAGTTPAVDGGEDAGPPAVDTPDAGRGEAPDLSLGRAEALEELVHAVEALAAAQEVLALFVDQAATLDLTGDGCANAELVAARVGDAVDAAPETGCARVAVACEDGRGTVEAAFDECALGDTGSTLSATVEASVRADGEGATRLVTVALQFAGLTLVSGERYELAGSLTTSTSDLSSYAVEAALELDERSLYFTGAVAAEPSAAGALAGVTLTGEGSIGSAGAAQSFAEWECTGSTFTYDVEALHRVTGACRADGGKLTASQQYACASTVTVRDEPKTITTSATVQDVITFREDTPQTNRVHAVTVTTVAGQTKEHAADVELPGKCAL